MKQSLDARWHILKIKKNFWGNWRNFFQPKTSIVDQAIFICAPAGAGKSTLIEQLSSKERSDSNIQKIIDFVSAGQSAHIPYTKLLRQITAGTIAELMQNQIIFVHVDTDNFVQNFEYAVPILSEWSKCVKQVGLVTIDPTLDHLQKCSFLRYQNSVPKINKVIQNEIGKPSSSKSSIRLVSKELRRVGTQLDRLPGYGWKPRDPNMHARSIRHLRAHLPLALEVTLAHENQQNNQRFFGELLSI